MWPATNIDPVLSSTSATRSRELPKLAVETAASGSVLKPITPMKLVL
jgi:hypothetical protein